MRAGPMVAALMVGCVPRADAGAGAGSLHAAGDECTAQSKQDVRVDTRLVDDWAELEPTLAGVYLAEIRVRTGADGHNEICATASELLFGAALPRRSVCTRLVDLDASTLSMPPLPTSGSALVATARRRGREAILGAVATDDCGGECRTRFREVLWQQLRCGLISRFWSEIPREDRRCTRDDECALLSTTCFDASVRADRRAPYDEVLAVHGVCIDPAAGACAPSRAVARCDARLCTVR
jgi:hypothetical protein